MRSIATWRVDLLKRAGLAVLILALIVQGTAAAVSASDWPQFGRTSQHSGNNSEETAIGSGNVASLHQAFRVTLPSVADGAPAYLTGVATPGGVKDLLFLTTKDGHVLALDAKSGSQVWSHQYGPGSCISSNGGVCYTTSSPAIDPNRQFVYSYGLDGYVHKYQVGDGTEIKGNGWPELTTLKPDTEKGSSALSVAATPRGSYLYASHAGYPGDGGDYQGHVTAINLSSGAQHVFNTMCSNQVNAPGYPYYDVHFVKNSSPDCGAVQSAVWGRPGVTYDAQTGKIYLSTGNGTFDPSSFDWGDSILALNPDGTGGSNGAPLDSFTPADYLYLQGTDADLGSTTPVILPAVPANSTVRHLAVQGGKGPACQGCSGIALWLVNLDNLSQQGGPAHVGGQVGWVPVPQGAGVVSQPATWVNPDDGSTWVFVTTSSGISALKLTVNASGTPGLQSMWQNAAGGTSPIVANGVLFYAASGTIRALDPVSGRQLWSDTTIGGIHWESPIVANGMVYITDESRQLTAYAPASGTSPAACSSRDVLTRVSRQQYALSASDGLTWADLDRDTLALSLTPSANCTAVLSANADLWTSSAGYNQDLGIVVSGGGYTGIVAWKESGGAASYSPNAAFVHAVLSLQAGTTYTIKLQWKANRADAGTIWAGAGPDTSGQYSPTRLTATLFPVGSTGATIATKVSTQQYLLSESNGSNWVDVDPTNLSLSVTSPNNVTAVLFGNADLWTTSAGYNQDLGIWISGGSYGNGQLVAWKESGGAFAYAPNAALVHAIVSLQAQTAYTIRLRWKTNRSDPGNIWAGAGPVNGAFSPTRLTAELLSTGATGTVVASKVTNAQHVLTNSDGRSWIDMDLANLSLTLTPSSSCQAVLSANADLWTSVAGHNQDLGIFISGGSFGSGQLLAWKESGGAAATSPNAAFVQTVASLAGGTAYSIKLDWKANYADGSAIYAGAGPSSGQYSPTRLTVEC